MKFTLKFVIIAMLLVSCKSEQESFQIGVMTDCQYCDCDIKWGRYYEQAPGRLDSIVRYFNKQNLDFSIHLGDFIDKDIASLEHLMPTWNSLNDPKYHVLGNHDFDVADSLKGSIPELMGLKSRYYSFKNKGWKFIVLDGNDMSLYGPSEEFSVEESRMYMESEASKGNKSALFYNGGIGPRQLEWLKTELEQSESMPVLIFSHFPIYPLDNHNVWNNAELIDLIEPYPNIKAVFTGHNHAGSYEVVNGVHFLTFKAIVDTPDENAYALVKIENQQIIVNGFGREPDRILKLKP